MADNGATPTGAPNAPAQPPISVNVQYVKDLSFENPGSPATLADLNPPPEIGVDINVEVRKLQDRVFEVVLHIRARAQRQEKTFFMVELSYGGVCVVGSQVAEEHIQPLVTIEGPRMLFPFARGVIANAVRDGGFPPLLINPIDFARLYQQQAQAAQQQNQPTASA